MIGVREAGRERVSEHQQLGYMEIVHRPRFKVSSERLKKQGLGWLCLCRFLSTTLLFLQLAENFLNGPDIRLISDSIFHDLLRPEVPDI